MDGQMWSPARGHGREGMAGHGARLGRALRRVGAAPVVLLGYLVELGWAFVGSLGLGLGVSPAAGAPEAHLWLGGALAIAGLAAWAAIVAAPRRATQA